MEWSSLATTNVPAGPRSLRFRIAPHTPAVLIPPCAGRQRVVVDGRPLPSSPGPIVADLPADDREHVVTIDLDVSGYEHRIACGAAPRGGARASRHDGFARLHFASSNGGGDAVVYVPPGHDVARAGALLVGLHPWNGTPWTYAAYAPLLDAARSEDVVLLFPSGLGNSLYTARAEAEVLRALGALGGRVAVDPDRVTLWGASMGGAGATTIGFHHPDRFAAVVSLFGDSKYDLATYVRAILHDERGAHRVNALDIVENARNLPVWLIHGEDDHSSPLFQSAVLDRALEAEHFAHRFDRVPGAGHEGRVVSQFARAIVEFAASARRAAAPERVSYASVAPDDAEAYGIRLVRGAQGGDAFFDIARKGDAVHLLAARNVRALRLPRGAFGVAPTVTAPVVHDDPSTNAVDVTWDRLP